MPEVDIQIRCQRCGEQMELREEHVVAVVANWRRKSDNLLSLAADLCLSQGAFLFVDDSPERDAYTGQGFGKIGDVKPETSEMSKPGFTPSQWWSYLSNVMSLSPVPKDIKFGEVPQGVLQLGGTFVIEGDDVTYAWADPIPGQHPEPEDVLTAAGVP